jgi:hypothetical protein
MLKALMSNMGAK